MMMMMMMTMMTGSVQRLCRYRGSGSVLRTARDDAHVLLLLLLLLLLLMMMMIMMMTILLLLQMLLLLLPPLMLQTILLLLLLLLGEQGCGHDLWRKAVPRMSRGACSSICPSGR